MKYKIIDFHTHIFRKQENNICCFKNNVSLTLEKSVNMFKNLNVENICGSVLYDGKINGKWESVESLNNEALKIAKLTNGFYIPGFHVHPDFKKESINEIERMNKLGIKIIGELVPYMQGWSDYSSADFFEILECAEHYNMIVNFHPMNEEQMDQMVKRFRNITFVAAHPGEYNEFMRQLKRMEMSDNYYLDLSGYGIFRHGMLRYGIDRFDKSRFLFGSDYPTCNFPMYAGAILLDELISDEEKQAVLYDNAHYLLKKCGAIK